MPNAMTTFAGAQATDQHKEASNLHRSCMFSEKNKCTVDASSASSDSLHGASTREETSDDDHACKGHACIISDDEAASIIEMIVDENTETNWGSSSAPGDSSTCRLWVFSVGAQARVVSATQKGKQIDRQKHMGGHTVSFRCRPATAYKCCAANIGRGDISWLLPHQQGQWARLSLS